VELISRGLDHARQMVRIAPGRPAVALGVRAALATLAPLLAAPWIGAGVATWATIGGFIVALADKGGAYRTRALTLGGATLGAAASVALGALAAPHAIVAVALMFVWATVSGFAGVLGPAAVGPGTTMAVLFAVSLASPAPTPALVRAAGILGGGAWSMVLALLFWPVRVYGPVRVAIAGCYRTLRRQLAEIAGSTGTPAASVVVSKGHGSIRAALETARGVLAATRRGRLGESGRGARLLVLLQAADLMFASLIALEEVLAGAPVPGPLADVLRAACGALDDVAARIETERHVQAALALDWDLDRLRADPAHGGASAQHALALLERLRSLTQLALEVSTSLYDEREPAPVLVPDQAAEPSPLLERVRAHLTFDSALSRHALRLGTTTAVALLLTRVIGLRYGYWVTITVVVLLQPYTTATVTKVLQRVAGTVGGGVVAAVIVATVHDRGVLIALAALFGGVSAAVLQINYALFSFLLTPTFVLLAETSAQDPHLVELRIVNTVLGATLAFVAALVLWPHAERRRFPDEMAAGLRALAGYWRETIRVLVEHLPVPAPSLSAARRGFGLTMSGADASFERLLAERGASPAAQEAGMTLLLYPRRIAATLAAVASTRTVVPARPYAAALDELGRAVVALLEDLAAALRAGRVPAPLPPLEDAARIDSPLLAPRLARLVEQLTVLHHAALRWHEARDARWAAPT
jgi:uncharacterized membrane protein YccC